MGPQSTTTHRHTLTPFWVALVLLLLPLRTRPQATVSATTVPLILPSAILFDPQGNLYLAETANHVIRKVDPTGIITTVAGTGTQGFSGDNGPATVAQLDSPQGLALDTANNLYIADTHNHRVRRIDAATGIITTIAGTTSGFSGDSGPATAAQLNLPTALAIDTSGNLYIADTQNHRIRRITTTTGIITTIAGTGTQGFSGDNGPATAATIDSPTGLAVDATGNLYLADTHNHRIRRITAAGIITTIAGTAAPGFSGDDAPASTASLALPHGVTIDAIGNLYIADTANHRIRRIDAAASIITTIAGEGTQAFTGDGSLATTAALDTPRTVTLTSNGLPTLADTGNQRIRQISSDKTIHTIAGLGATTPGALTLSAPTVIGYGTGRITATLASSSPATGIITFLDTYNSATTIGSAPLTANSATLNTSILPAGIHNITATYAGDQTHASAQSTTIFLTITPQPLTAAVSPSTILYGQPIPSFAATLTGLLSQDTGSLTASLSTTATTLSPTGTYPVATILTGPAAGNYTLANTPTLTITQAPSLTTLTTPSATISPGSSITLTTHVASTTSGSPTGTISLLDGSTTLRDTTISPTGDASFTTSTLSIGSHTLTAIYHGDNNFSPSTSVPAIIGVGVVGGSPSGPDFTIAATGSTTQTILSGTSASYTFAIQSTGSTQLSSPITLAVTGLPNLATASFNPAYLPPGTASNNLTLTIAIPAAAAQNHSSKPQITTWALLLFPIGAITLRLQNPRAKSPILLLSIILAVCWGCGARINTGTQSISANPAQTYTITVTGTATSATGTILQHAATVTLIVQPPN